MINYYILLTHLTLHSSLQCHFLMLFTPQEEMMAKMKVHHMVKVLRVCVCVRVCLRDLSNKEVK